MACKITPALSPRAGEGATSSDEDSLPSAVAIPPVQGAAVPGNTNYDWDDDEEGCQKPYPRPSAGVVEDGNCNDSVSGNTPFFQRTLQEDMFEAVLCQDSSTSLRRCHSEGHLVYDGRPLPAPSHSVLDPVYPRFRPVWPPGEEGGTGVKVDCCDSACSQGVMQQTSSASHVTSDVNFTLDPACKFGIDQTRSASTVEVGETGGRGAGGGGRGGGFRGGLDVEGICSNMDDMEALLALLVQSVHQHSDSPDPQSHPLEQPCSSPPDPSAPLGDTVLAIRQTWLLHRKLMEGLLEELARREDRVSRLMEKQAKLTAVNTRLRQERQDLQVYLKDKECDWLTMEKALKAEAEMNRTRLLELARTTKEGANPCAVLQSLLQMHFDREQCIALDTAKQNKINQLKLLVFRQQMAIRELEEHNADLVNLLRDISAHQGVEVSESGDHGSHVVRASLSEVLRCDQGFFLPHRSRHPALAALQVLSIGGRQGDIRSSCEEEFDLSRLLGRPPSPSLQTPDLARSLLESLTRHGPACPNFKLDD